MLDNDNEQGTLSTSPQVHMDTNPTHTRYECCWLQMDLLDETLERYKAQLNTNGFHQREGWDYNMTYSLVVKVATIRTTLTLVVARDWSLHHLDVCNAFLNDKLMEEVFMEQTLDFINLYQPRHVCKLN